MVWCHYMTSLREKKSAKLHLLPLVSFINLLFWLTVIGQERSYDLIQKPLQFSTSTFNTVCVLYYYYYCHLKNISSYNSTDLKRAISKESWTMTVQHLFPSVTNEQSFQDHLLSRNLLIQRVFFPARHELWTCILFPSVTNECPFQKHLPTLLTLRTLQGDFNSNYAVYSLVSPLSDLPFQDDLRTLLTWRTLPWETSTATMQFPPVSDFYIPFIYAWQVMGYAHLHVTIVSSSILRCYCNNWVSNQVSTPSVTVHIFGTYHWINIFATLHKQVTQPTSYRDIKTHNFFFFFKKCKNTANCNTLF